MTSVDKVKNKAQKGKRSSQGGAREGHDDRTFQARGKGHQAAGNLKQAGEKVMDGFGK